MPFDSSSSAIHLTNLNSGSTLNPIRPLQNVTIHPVALFSILDHYLRRTDAQDRVLGMLLGTRTETEVEVHNTIATMHNETAERITVDKDHIRTAYELHHRVHPKEVIVGWYSTGSKFNLYSALVQDFFAQETAPYAAVYVALNTGTDEGSEPGVKAFLGSPVGIYPKSENCVFTPIPCELRFNSAEKSGLDLLIKSLDPDAASTASTSSEIQVLERSVRQVSDMLDRALAYVRSVNAGETKGDPAVGRFLLDTFATSPEGLDQGSFASSLQDTLMISYLANLIRAQAEVSARLQLVTAS